MRRLNIVALKHWLIGLLACLALGVLGTSYLSHVIGNPVTDKATNGQCALTCHQPSQPINGDASKLINAENDDKEPGPPYAIWLTPAAVVLFIAGRQFQLRVRFENDKIYLLQERLRI